MIETEHRQHPRLQHRAKLNVSIPSLSLTFVAEMSDFSEGGLFIMWPEPLTESLEEGTLLQVQTTEFEDAPIQTAAVVRAIPGDGIALKFVSS